MRDMYKSGKYGKYGRIKSIICLLFIAVVLAAGFTFNGQLEGIQNIIDNDDSCKKDKASGQCTYYTADQQKKEKRQTAVESAKLVNDYAQSESDKISVSTQHKSVSRAVEAQYSSVTPMYKIDVSIREQKVRIYDEDRLIKEWIVSTGKNNSTPLGSFTTKNKGDWFFSEKYQQGGKWWIAFQGNYLFHSIPMDRNQNIIAEDAEMLGMPASHGCIRLEVEHAKWLHNNIPKGTPVIIHH
jgi:lipoprotein-anchoring transpeptidase ErfK/SrfK